MIISSQVISLLSSLNINQELVSQAVKAWEGNRKLVSSESLGTVNGKKSRLATSKQLDKYETPVCVVSAFVQWGESETGTVDKAIAKSAKCGLVSTLASIPATVSGFDVSGWLLNPAWQIAKPSPVEATVKSSRKSAKGAKPEAEKAPAIA